MLHHLKPTSSVPARAVVLGAGGFVGGAIVRHLMAQNVAVLAVRRDDLDLTAADAAARLAAMLRADDAVVMVSAQAPCRTPAMMTANIRMAEAMCDVLTRRPVAHVVYLSSDAVYVDSSAPLTEASPAAPTTLHGAMHLAREQMFASIAGDAPLAILRPTLIYGASDPHNGYGPNRFRRLANRAEPIVLFGAGEERRDHVDIDDVAAIAALVLSRRSRGILNVATGAVTSFRRIAEQTAVLAPRPVLIRCAERHGAMPHNGYRAFDPAATAAAFPDFRYTSLADGLARAQQLEFG
jgi:nucleoside-diphosphate-sugar epimerase